MVAVQHPYITEQDWEQTWAPYDEATYAQALQWVGRDDVVLDIGAGDLRLARRMADVARRVVAIEQNSALLTDLASLPTNISVRLGDARRVVFPSQVTVAVLLMRHCRNFATYFDKLCAAGCRWLITNARWGMGVERIDLWGERVAGTAVSFGWYACRCGAVGFIPGKPEWLTPDRVDRITELESCSACTPHFVGRSQTQQRHISW